MTASPRPQLPTVGDSTNDPGLSRQLTARHIRFIALGGAIGAGLFLGSGEAIKIAGPAVLVAYAVAGIVVFLMARAMGELVLNRPQAVSFIVHIDDAVGRWAGFFTGWSYWLIWVLMGIAEITAVGVLAGYWFPGFPQWASALITLAALYCINQVAVRWFGEIEFWLALVKVVAISAFIIGGALVIAFPVDLAGADPRVANLWSHGGFLPYGVASLTAAAPLVLFAFGGTELIGVTTAEAEDAHKSVPRAINGVVLRILIFYVGSLAVIISIVPWTSLSAAESPFVVALESLGFDGAAALINVIVWSAVISSCNSGVFATGRLLLSLSVRGQAPAFLRRINQRHLPGNAIDASCLVMLLGVAFNYYFPGRVFAFVLSLVTALLLWTWAMILIAQFLFRVRRPAQDRLLFAMPFFPLSNLLALLFMGWVAVMLWVNAATRITAYSAITWFALLAVAYLWWSRTRAYSPVG